MNQELVLQQTDLETLSALMVESVSKFIEAFEMSPSVDLWMNLYAEERAELLEAMALNVTDDTVESLENVLKEACDLAYVFTGLLIVLQYRKLTTGEWWDNDADSLISSVGNVFSPDALAEAFRRVHASNMSKLGDDGKPVRHEDGKVLKGPNYQPPNLRDLVTPVYAQKVHDPHWLVKP